MIKILDNTKALNTLVNDTTNGLGRFEALSALITEELNGIYEAEITLLDTDKHFSDLAVNSILKMQVNEVGNEQMFRVYFISKPINHQVTIKCQHITYDLNKIAVKPFTATGAVNAKNGMLNNIIGTYPFSMTTDISNTTSKFTLDIPRSFRECLGGYEGSLLDVFRGEYEWDNLTVKMLAKRGNDNGVRIAYGKNLTDFTQEENIENVYTSVLGYAVVNDITYTGNVYHKISATYPKVKIVDFSSEFDENNTPTTAKLTTLAQTYATNNDIEVPNVNITISFVPLYQTEEYKDIAPLERVNLGDTVHVYFESLGVEASSRVVKTVWNVNLGRYDSIELGNTKANLNSVLNEVVSETKQTISNSQGFLESQLNEMATLIINGLGLHRTYVDTGDGAYRIYLHNKPTLEESDTQYILTSEGFLISTDYGQTFNAGFDSEGNAVLNSLATITLKALEISGSTIRGTDIYGTNIYGSNITFGDTSNKYITAKSNTANSGVIFEGNGDLNFTTRGTLDITNFYTDGTTIQNQLYMLNGNSVNRTYWLNNKYGVANTGNNIYMSSSDNINYVEVINNHTNTLGLANRLYMVSSSNNRVIENYTQLTVNGVGNTTMTLYLDSHQTLGETIHLYLLDTSGQPIFPVQLLMTYNNGTATISLSTNNGKNAVELTNNDIYIKPSGNIYMYDSAKGNKVKLTFNNGNVGYTIV